MPKKQGQKALRAQEPFNCKKLRKAKRDSQSGPTSSFSFRVKGSLFFSHLVCSECGPMCDQRVEASECVLNESWKVKPNRFDRPLVAGPSIGNKPRPLHVIEWDVRQTKISNFTSNTFISKIVSVILFIFPFWLLFSYNIWFYKNRV